ncbi:hypothetical protein RA26_00420 [Leisingera sp. ANG-M7]|nr:hypothetical protein RA26_00420 [Leisingera sp. ANG-M7]
MLDKFEDWGAIAEDDDLLAVLHCLKPAGAHLSQKGLHPGITFDVAALTADHTAVLHRLAGE